MRLIDADALKEMICNNVYPITDFFNSQDYGMFWTGGIEKAINEAPTIEAEPVRHGYWEVIDEIEPRRYGCSCCKRLTYSQENYCPHCGAKMGQEESDEADISGND